MTVDLLIGPHTDHTKIGSDQSHKAVSRILRLCVGGKRTLSARDTELHLAGLGFRIRSIRWCNQQPTCMLELFQAKRLNHTSQIQLVVEVSDHSEYTLQVMFAPAVACMIVRIGYRVSYTIVLEEGEGNHRGGHLHCQSP